MNTRTACTDFWAMTEYGPASYWLEVVMKWRATAGWSLRRVSLPSKQFRPNTFACLSVMTKEFLTRADCYSLPVCGIWRQPVRASASFMVRASFTALIATVTKWGTNEWPFSHMAKTQLDLLKTFWPGPGTWLCWPINMKSRTAPN